MLRSKKVLSCFLVTAVLTSMFLGLLCGSYTIQTVQAAGNPITMVAFGDVHYYNAQDGLSSVGDTWSGTQTIDGTVICQHDDGHGISDGDYGKSVHVNSRVFRLQGVPEDQSEFRGVDYANGEITTTRTDNGEGIYTAYHSVPYEVDGVIYIWGMEPPDGTNVFKNPVLRKSTDNGKTWTSSTNTASTLGTKFGWPCFFQYRAGGEAPSPVVDQADKYVYMLSPSNETKDPNNPYTTYYRDHYYLIRVLRSDLPLLDATKFEYYKGGIGGDGTLSSNWSNNINDLTPMYTDTGKCCFGHPVYNESLGRYVMTYMLSWQDTPSPFWVLEAPHPWGPWTKVVDQQMNATVTKGLAHFMLTNAYMRNDGRKMWAFAGSDCLTTPSTYEFHYLPIYLTNQTKTTLQAEDSTLLGSASTGSTKTGYTGTGYATGFSTVGNGVRFSINASSAGYYIISIRYANTSDEGAISVFVNGSRQTRMPVTCTEQYWGTWTEDARVYYLNSGNNTFDIKLMSSDSASYLYVDSLSYAFLQLSDPDTAGTYYQAESATLSGGAVSGDNEIINYKGNGYAKMQASGGNMQFNVNVSSSRQYKLYIRYSYGTAQGSTLTNIALKVNGNKVKNIRLGTTYNRKLETKVEAVDLLAGSNTITLNAESDSGNALYVDYILLVDPDNIPAPPETWTPVDDNATGGPIYTGSWHINVNSEYWRQNMHWSNTSGNYMEYSFTGTGIRWIGGTNNDHGKADIYIDGVLDKTVDTYSPSWVKQKIIYQKTGLDNIRHTIKIQLRSDKNPSSSNYYTDIDVLAYTKANIKQLDDADSGITYSGSWTATNNTSGYLYDTCHYSATSGNYIQYTFNGTGIQWIGGANSDHGKADVYIDGVLDKTVDTYSPTWNKQKVLYAKSGLSSGSHTIRIQVRSDKNNSSSGYITDIDSFIYTELPTEYIDDTGSGITYSGSWIGNVSQGYINNSVHYSNTSGDYIQYTFTGTSIKWIGATNNDHGKADIYIDGAFVQTVDTYSSTWEKQKVLYSRTELSSGNHTIKIQVRSDKNPSSSGYYTDLDTFIVR